MISRLIIVNTMISRLIFDNIFPFQRCNIDLLWRNEIKLRKDLRPGDSVDDSGMVDSVGGLEVVVSVGGSVGILMHTPSLQFSSLLSISIGLSFCYLRTWKKTTLN